MLCPPLPRRHTNALPHLPLMLDSCRSTYIVRAPAHCKCTNHIAIAPPRTRPARNLYPTLPHRSQNSTPIALSRHRGTANPGCAPMRFISSAFNLSIFPLHSYRWHFLSRQHAQPRKPPFRLTINPHHPPRWNSLALSVHGNFSPPSAPKP